MIKRFCDMCGSDLVITPVRTKCKDRNALIMFKHSFGGRRGVRGYDPDLCVVCYEAVAKELHADAKRLLASAKQTGGEE